MGRVGRLPRTQLAASNPYAQGILLSPSWQRVAGCQTDLQHDSRRAQAWAQGRRDTARARCGWRRARRGAPRLRWGWRAEGERSATT